MTRHIEPQPVTEEVCANCTRLWWPMRGTGRCSYCGCATTRERVAATPKLVPVSSQWRPSDGDR